MSQQAKLHRIVQQIEASLKKYEATDGADNWNTSFEVGEYCGNKTFPEIIKIHNQLLSAGLSVDKLKLLNFVERGRLYDFLKNPEERHGTWNDVCRELDVCKRTFDRYIDFFNIVNAYPRLFICELSFEMIVIMMIYKQLNEYLNVNEDLMLKLQQPSKQTRLSGGGGIFSSRNMPGR